MTTEQLKAAQAITRSISAAENEVQTLKKVILELEYTGIKDVTIAVEHSQCTFTVVDDVEANILKDSLVYLRCQLEDRINGYKDEFVNL